MESTEKRESIDAGIYLDVMGINEFNAPGHHSIRLKGNVSWLLMCFRTPFHIMTKSGVEEGQPGDCILHDPGFPEWHGPTPGSAEGFRNDWMHLNGDAVPHVVEHFGIPVNQRIPTGNSEFVAEAFSAIFGESLDRQPFWRDSVSLRIRGILLDLGRVCVDLSETGKWRHGEIGQRLTFGTARAQIHEQPQKDWTIAQMAALTGLGEHRFSMLYKQFYGVSPGRDLILARLGLAKSLLLLTDATLESIAHWCGLTDASYLSRLFKRELDCTPGQFRQFGTRYKQGESSIRNV